MPTILAAVALVSVARAPNRFLVVGQMGT